MMPPRIGIVGARRERNGLGPFVARDLVGAGALVTCFLATSEASREKTRRELHGALGIEAQGYVDLDAMLAEPLDALAILSPAETHGRYLEAALDRGLHVLCEKPFVWGGPSLAATTAKLAAGFDARGLLLWENCQWPYTLPGYDRLFAGARRGAPQRFEMRLQPASTGRQALGDSLPHAFSLLQAVVPGEAPALDGVRFATRDAHADHQVVAFDYRAGGATVAAEITLDRGARPPREASIALDGRRAHRRVSGEDYRLSFASGDREVTLEDPLQQLVADFVQALGDAARRSRAREIADRMALLETAVEAWNAAEPG